MTTQGLSVRIWQDAAIARRNDDGYANATAMCKANGREWFSYARADRTQEYITALSEAIGVPADQLIQTRQGGIPELQGTWIHPRLAVDLARWISPAFAVWMDGWFLDAAGAANSKSPRPLRRPKRQPVLPHISTTCAFCGKTFDARSLSAVFCSAKCRVYAFRHRKQGKPFPASVSTALTTAPTPSLPPGVHVVANNPRHANWLWAQAVEAHVSAALMHSLARDNRHAINSPHFQPHLTHSLR
jgi:hypothetical protein